jgi:hypothetical protein
LNRGSILRGLDPLTPGGGIRVLNRKGAKNTKKEKQREIIYSLLLREINGVEEIKVRKKVKI